MSLECRPHWLDDHITAFGEEQGKSFPIYIYIYREREREREILEFCCMLGIVAEFQISEGL